MEKFFGTILCIILVFWIFSLIGRVLLRRWIMRKQREMEEHLRGGGEAKGGFRGFYTSFGGKQTGRKRDGSEKKEGDVTIESNETQKGVNKEIGEYVDFEEIDKDDN